MTNAQETLPPRWHGPSEGSEDAEETCLKLYNSLVDGKVRGKWHAEAVQVDELADASRGCTRAMHENVELG